MSDLRHGVGLLTALSKFHAGFEHAQELLEGAGRSECLRQVTAGTWFSAIWADGRAGLDEMLAISI